MKYEVGYNQVEGQAFIEHIYSYGPARWWFSPDDASIGQEEQTE